MPEAHLTLRVLLPHKVFVEVHDVRRITVETGEGHYGLLPHRVDCAANLVAGILFYESAAEGEAYVAVDEGVLVKTGLSVCVAVRRAVGHRALGELRAAVHREFLALDDQERVVRQVMEKLETGLLRRLGELHHG